MLRGVLFDLDGTLLDIELDSFFREYLGAIRAYAGPRLPDMDLLGAIMAGTEVMQVPHPGITNREAFYADFLARTGVDLVQHWGVFESFYRDVFPTLRAHGGPVTGACEAVETARELGLKVAIATQPIFPELAIAHRLAWAGLEGAAFDALTAYEVMRACKPQSEFFLQTAAMIGCDPTECLMVGDDRGHDMPASAVGMTTYYVGPDPEAPASYRGALSDLPALLRRLAGGSRD